MPSTAMHRLPYLVGLLASVLLVLALLALPREAFAADKADIGGTCCSDLEERIAELEATTAAKGNRKVKLTISGQINKALLWHDGFGTSSDAKVTENSASESYVGFYGEARVSPSVKVGFALEIGVGGYDDSNRGYGPFLDGDTNGIYTRQSFLYVEHATLGKLSLGHQKMAADEITEITTANTGVAVRPLSARPLYGPQIGDVADIFDGGRADAIRYDSPAFAGFKASASWANADLTGNSDMWDVAIRFAKDIGEFRVGAGVGFRQGIAVPTIGATDDIRVFSGSASVMHLPTGVFVTGAAGRLEGNGALSFVPELNGWQVQGGVEERWNTLGKTTLYGEYGRLKIDTLNIEPTLYGIGIVQSVDAAAMDFYLSYRRYDLDTPLANDELDTVMAGARIRF